MLLSIEHCYQVFEATGTLYTKHRENELRDRYMYLIAVRTTHVTDWIQGQHSHFVGSVFRYACLRTVARVKHGRVRPFV